MAIQRGEIYFVNLDPVKGANSPVCGPSWFCQVTRSIACPWW